MGKRSDIKPLPSLERLNELFVYEPLTGDLRWKSVPKKFQRAKVGDLVGTIGAKGYRIVGVDRVQYLAHRIIWKMVTGEEPADQIDHEDTNRLNNRWTNFRPVTNGKNVWNSKLRKDNKSGFKGVHFKQGRWRAVLGGSSEGKRQKHIGCFATAEEAASAWRAAAEVQRGEYFREV
jgi:hypothetical protein